MRLEPKPFLRSYFNMLATLLNEETLWLWEHFNNTAAWNKTHETGYFLQATRFMLAMERNGELHLAPLVPSVWLKHGNAIGVTNMLTRFGTVSYRIQSRAAQGVIDAQVTLQHRQQPDAVYLHLRHPNGKPIRRVTVNGQEYRDFAGVRVRLPVEEGTFRVEAQF